MVAIPGAITLIVDVVLWIIAASHLWLRIGLGLAGLVLLAPFLVSSGRLLRATWRRGAGFYRVLDAEIAEGEHHVATARQHPKEWEGWEFWTEASEWERRVHTIMASYGPDYLNIFWPEGEVEVAAAWKDPGAGPDPDVTAFEHRLKRLRRIREMGPPNG